MGIAQSFERRLEQFVEGFFARTFRSGLQPVELGRKLAREMGRTKTVTSTGVVVANHFTVALSEADTQRFNHFADKLRGELVAGLTGECQNEGWQTLGSITVEFQTDPALRIGRFVIESRIVEGNRELATASAPPPPAAAPQPSPAPPAQVPAMASSPEPQPAGVATSNPRLVGDDGVIHALSDDTFRIGRLQDCQARFDDANVSRHHAELRRSGDSYSVIDLGSTNGTLVNGIRIAGETRLSDGDTIRVGNNSLTFRT